MPQRRKKGQRGSTLVATRTSPTLLIASFAVLIAALVLAYWPALAGGILWDDEGHITRPALRSLRGLWRIWFELGATQQYYPIVHSLFWLQAQLWGDNYLGYHLTSLVLHATSAVLVMLIVQKLEAPGALLAATLFALHPVEVESVAWISELKNTASLLCYLASALSYLAFEKSRRRGTYLVALALFVCALLSKSVTLTLPAGLLVVLWWRRGSLQWRRDVRPLVPFFALGVAAGVLTSWVERTFIGATGVDFSLRPIERVLVAGHATLFYLEKLVWPWPLKFFYERWDVTRPASFIYPMIVTALIVGTWLLRRRTRAPFAVLLLFLATISPALGFVDAYPFRYSWVADHFQYHASVGVLVGVSAALTLAWRRWASTQPEWILMALCVTPMAILTHQHSQDFHDAETLYRTTIAKNPDAWLAHNNLATLIVHRSAADQREAFAHYQEAIRLKPTDGMLRDNLATTLNDMGRRYEALGQEFEAVRLAPRYPIAWINLGITLQNLGRVDEAIDAYNTALKLDPALTEIRINLGLALAQRAQFEPALAQLVPLVTEAPNSPQARIVLADVLSAAGHAEEAEKQYRIAVTLAPADPHPRTGLASVLLQAGRTSEAEGELRAALQVAPNDVVAQQLLADTRQRLADPALGVHAGVVKRSGSP